VQADAAKAQSSADELLPSQSPIDPLSQVRGIHIITSAVVKDGTLLMLRQHILQRRQTDKSAPKLRSQTSYAPEAGGTDSAPKLSPIEQGASRDTSGVKNTKDKK
jgi:hypothetical protein